MENYIICTSDRVEVAGVPEEIKILPLGFVHSQKGDFIVDDESFELMRKQFKDRSLDLVVDYEHQTLADVQAPAAGWIKELKKGTDAIIAKVEWTKRAAEYLKNKEYRYLSPVVLVGKKDKKARVLHSVALTNTPAIDGMFPVVNAVNIDDFTDVEGGTNIMDLKELAKLLGLPEEASEEEVKKAAAAAAAVKAKEEKEKEEGTGKDANKQELGKDTGNQAVTTVANSTQAIVPVANSTVLSLLGLDGTAKTEDVAASIMALKAGNLDAQAEFLKLKEKIENQEAEELVEKALKSGKISAAQKDWAKEYALSNKKGFESFLEKAPVVVPLGKMELKDAPQSMEVDPMILKATGMTEEEIKKYGKLEV